LQRLFEAGRHEKAAMLRQPPDEKLEDGGIVHSLLEVRLQHGELIQVGEQGARFTLEH